MKYFKRLCFILPWMLISQGLSTQDATSSTVEISFPAQSSSIPQFWSDLCFFRGSEGYTQIEFYYSLASGELTFDQSDEKNAATFTYSLIIKNSQDQIVINQSKLKQLQVMSAEETQDKNKGIIDQLIFDLKPGEYHLEFKIVDELEKQTSKIEREIVVPTYDEALSFSSPLFASLISKATAASPFVKGNKNVIPNVSRKYQFQKSFLYLYLEIYNMYPPAAQTNNSVELNYALATLAGDTVLFVPAQTFAKPGTSCIKTQTMNIFDFQPGEYILYVNIKDFSSGQTASCAKNFWVFEQRETIPVTEADIKRYRNQIKYFATAKELEVFDMLPPEEIEAYLVNFWHKRDTSPETPDNEFMLDVFAKIDYANKHFKGIGSGLNSDMGRVFVIYGQPDEIENYTMNMEGKPYLIWHYYTSGSGKHYFVFVDKNMDGVYTLVHSSVVSEIKDEAWREREL